MKKDKIFIKIEDYYDGFGIIINKNGEEKKFHFDQEDMRKKMKALFESLGFETEYEEIY